MPEIHSPASRRAWATSSRNAGRHHLGIPGGIMSVCPGGFVGIRIDAGGAKEAIGHGIRSRRSKSGAVSFDLLEMEGGHASIQ